MNDPWGRSAKSIPLFVVAARLYMTPTDVFLFVKAGNLPVFIPNGVVVKKSDEFPGKYLWVYEDDYDAYIESRLIRWLGDEPRPLVNPLGRYWVDVKERFVPARLARLAPCTKIRRHLSPRPRPPGGKAPPFGWRIGPDTVTLFPVTREQDVIGRMMVLRASGKNRRQIAEELTAHGCRQRDGTTAWRPGTVAGILAREDAIAAAASPVPCLDGDN